jgi:hypothetical protein
MITFSDFKNLNYTWAKQVFKTLKVNGSVHSAHMAIVDNATHGFALGFEKSKRRWDFPGGASDRSIGDPVEQFLEALYRELHEELAVTFEVPLEDLGIWIIPCGKYGKNILCVCVADNIPTAAIRAEMIRKQRTQLPYCFREMSDFKLTGPEDLPYATTYVQEQYEAIIRVANRHRGEVCSFKDVTHVGHEDDVAALALAFRALK